jgi:hypothetical protein
MRVHGSSNEGQRKRRKTMHEFMMYLERADDDEPKVFLGIVRADCGTEALDLAAQWYEYPQHDLVYEQITPNHLFPARAENP